MVSIYIQESVAAMDRFAGLQQNTKDTPTTFVTKNATSQCLYSTQSPTLRSREAQG